MGRLQRASEQEQTAYTGGDVLGNAWICASLVEYRSCAAEYLGGIAPFPWMLAAGEAWGPERRDRQIERLERALPLEREAIAAIEEALTLAG